MGILNTIKKLFNSDNAPAEPPQTADALPDSFYMDTIEANRAEKDRFFRTSPYSPIADRLNFNGLDYYPPNPAYRFNLPLQRAESRQPLTFQTSSGDEQLYYRLGTVSFEVDGQPAQLTIYQSDDHDELFLPFRDATSGSETYGAGRYLEPELHPTDQLEVDFNLAYNPFCAFSEDYSCPLPPFENHLKVAIRAGERAFKK